MTSLTQLRPRILRAIRDAENGATAVEYGLIIALIATVIVGAVTALGLQLNTVFGNLNF